MDWVDGNLWLLGKERPDLDMAGSQITARIFRLGELYAKKLDALHSQFGLKPRMFLVLAALYRSGPPYKLAPANLLRHLMWSSAGLSQLLDRMEVAELIQRRKNGGGKRGVLVSLLPKGRKIITELLGIHCATEMRLIETLSVSERESLVSVLRKLLIAAEGPRLHPSSAAARTTPNRRRKQ